LVILIAKDCRCPTKVVHKNVEEPIESQKYEFYRAGKKRNLNADLYRIKGIKKVRMFFSLI
jgi:hypothetical protein